MPFVIAHIAKGRSLERRRRLAQAITAAVSDIFEIDTVQTQVLIVEHERDNWAIGGELLSERRPRRRRIFPTSNRCSANRPKSPRLSPQPESQQQNRDHGDKPGHPDRRGKPGAGRRRLRHDLGGGMRRMQGCDLCLRSSDRAAVPVPQGH